ncbi:hypothetical protein Ac2012v2_000951 [Leucoagaricus gongylophorus]
MSCQGFASRGVGAITVEATSVVPEGRISPQDAGLWTDTQIEPLKRITTFVHAQGTKIGIQLAHAGRKASLLAPWTRRATGNVLATEEVNGWPGEVYGPSDLSFKKGIYPDPRPISEEDINNKIIKAFVESTKRAEKAGFDFIELHAAHGYLLHSFVSPLSNTRDDIYGGQPLENRLRVISSLVQKVREVWSGPLFVRISATDWAEGPEKGTDGKWLQWGIEQSKILAARLQEFGVDLVDCSTGGNWAAEVIPHQPGYQVPFAAELKRAVPELLIGAVGLITEPEQAESYLKEGKTDVILLARALLQNPHWPLMAAQKLNAQVKPANQYERAWSKTT